MGAAKQEDDDDIARVVKKMEELAGSFMVTGRVVEIRYGYDARLESSRIYGRAAVWVDVDEIMKERMT